MSELEMITLHWVSAKRHWETIGWDDFLAFRGLWTKQVPLPGVAGGVHHFVVAVLDETRSPVNIIQHKYLIDPDGTIGADNFTGWTKEERDDYARLMTAPAYGPGEEDRLNQIQAKGGGAWDIPKDSILALVRALPDLPVAGSAAERFVKQKLTSWVAS